MMPMPFYELSLQGGSGGRPDLNERRAPRARSAILLRARLGGTELARLHPPHTTMSCPSCLTW